MAFLEACKASVRSYETPANTYFSRGFLEHLNPMIKHLVKCRPLSISMGNAIRFVKRLVSPIPSTMSDDNAKAYVVSKIDDFVDKRIRIADELIMRNMLGLEPNTTAKIVDGDVVLTYGRSHVVEEAFKFAHSNGTRFEVMVVDSRPRLEGKQLLRSLTACNIPCTYVLVSALSYVISSVTKVVLGAAGIMANGTAVSRIGTAVVAMMAHNHRKPVMFCCESYKFSDRVQLDSIVSNEVADPVHLVEKGSVLEGWQEQENLRLLNLSYDLTPQEFISVLITDVGLLPTTSVPGKTTIPFHVGCFRLPFRELCCAPYRSWSPFNKLKGDLNNGARRNARTVVAGQSFPDCPQTFLQHSL